jgi:hypothetical protein
MSLELLLCCEHSWLNPIDVIKFIQEGQKELAGFPA